MGVGKIFGTYVAPPTVEADVVVVCHPNFLSELLMECAETKSH